MSRAQFILDLLNKQDVAVEEKLRNNEESKSFDVDKLFQNRDCYESAPPSAVFSPNNMYLPSIQQPHSAPLVTISTDDDVISVEDLIQQDDTTKNPCPILENSVVQPSCSTDNPDSSTSKKDLIQEYDALPKSPYSVISGIESLGSSPAHDFSDSSVSWYPDSEEKNRSKKKRQIITLSSSDSSDSDDLILINRKNRKDQLIVENELEPSHRNDDTTSSNTFCESEDKEPILIVPPNHSNENVNAVIDTQESVEHQNSASDTTATNSTSKNIKRWKKRNPNKWKKTLAKVNRSKCLPYQNKTGKKMPAKKPKPVNCDINCRRRCLDSFTEDDRVKICQEYWKINEYVAQKQFLLQLIVPMPVKTLKAGIPDQKHRRVSYEYYFIKNDTKIRVCKQFFTNTLSISNGPINEAMKHKNEFGYFEGKDERGSHEPINKTSADSKQKIIDHINSFPRQESHYCRKTTQRQYLDSKLTIAKMYELYKEQLALTNEKPSSLYVYKNIFGSEFNLSFFVPKKDLCMICTRYDNAGRPADLKADYDAHIARKIAAQAAKELDKQRSIEDETYLVLTGDMQSTLHIPVCGVGILYYTRKLNVQNYTIHTAKPPNEAYCITWNEINGKRGSVEIASAINWWISNVPSTVKEVTIYSDTCAGQNRNQFITAFLLHLIQRPDLNLEVFEQKYLESGHTHMEVDSMHSAIEKEQRHTPVYSMIDWKSIMFRARSKRQRESAPPYVVKELTYDEMIDVRALNEKFITNTSKDKDGKKIMWLKIKCLRFEKQCPGIVKFRYSHDGPYSEFDACQKLDKVVPQTRKRRRLQRDTAGESDAELRPDDLKGQLKAYTIPMAYTAPLPISGAKKKDLVGLCHKGIIPLELHSWYESLPTNNKVVDRLVEPDFTEEGED